MPGIVIVDYGMGNLHSVKKAFEVSGCDAALSRAPAEVAGADALIVPGVGAFGHCIDNIERFGLREAILQFIRSDRPYLGLCLGLQILFASSEESEGSRGLGVLPGRVRRFMGPMKIPHMGWNTIHFPDGTGESTGRCPLFEGIPDGAHVYFVHSYYAEPAESGIVSSVTDYGVRFASAVWRGNIMATQFHPEKSQRVGLKILGNFIRFAGLSRA
jgi:glutamine amidotransferase